MFCTLPSLVCNNLVIDVNSLYIDQKVYSSLKSWSEITKNNIWITNTFQNLITKRGNFIQLCMLRTSSEDLQNMWYYL